MSDRTRPPRSLYLARARPVGRARPAIVPSLSRVHSRAHHEPRSLHSPRSHECSPPPSERRHPRRAATHTLDPRMRSADHRTAFPYPSDRISTTCPRVDDRSLPPSRPRTSRVPPASHSRSGIPRPSDGFRSAERTRSFPTT